MTSCARFVVPALTVGLVVSTLVSGCGAGSEADPAPSGRAPPDSAAAGGNAAAPIVLARSDYVLRPDGVAERTEIPFVYRNEGPDTLYHPTCRDESGRPALSLAVQRRLDGVWVDVWYQVVNQCLSDPVVIPPGGAHADTLQLWLHPQDSVQALHLTPSSNLSGPFRLVWAELLRTYDPDTYPFGEEIELSRRVSGAFTLRRP